MKINVSIAGQYNVFVISDRNDVEAVNEFNKWGIEHAHVDEDGNPDN